MNLISREELKEKIDRGDEFKLVMTLGEFGFRAKHIPGSLRRHIAPHRRPNTSTQTTRSSSTAQTGNVSQAFYAFESLEQAGYTRVARYAGGISDWEDAGYPLEGEAGRITRGFRLGAPVTCYRSRHSGLRRYHFSVVARASRCEVGLAPKASSYF